MQTSFYRRLAAYGCQLSYSSCVGPKLIGSRSSNRTTARSGSDSEDTTVVGFGGVLSVGFQLLFGKRMGVSILQNSRST